MKYSISHVLYLRPEYLAKIEGLIPEDYISVLMHGDARGSNITNSVGNGHVVFQFILVLPRLSLRLYHFVILRTTHTQLVASSNSICSNPFPSPSQNSQNVVVSPTASPSSQTIQHKNQLWRCKAVSCACNLLKGLLVIEDYGRTEFVKYDNGFSARDKKVDEKHYEMDMAEGNSDQKRVIRVKYNATTVTGVNENTNCGVKREASDVRENQQEKWGGTHSGDDDKRHI